MKKLLSIILILIPVVIGYAEGAQRIISLVPSVTEEIYLLNAEDKLIANTLYCTKPEAAKKKEKVGTVVEINVEKIVQLKPDLVLASSLTNPGSTRKLKKLGIEVITFMQPKNFPELSRQFLQLAVVTGKGKEAKRIIDTAERKISSVKENIEGSEKVKVFAQIGAKPLFTANKDSFINDLIELSGGINIARDVKIGFYSREEVLRQNPDVIIITTMGIGEQEKGNWQKYATLNAARNNRIHIVDPYKFCSPTPVTFVEALEEMTQILHPESSR